MSIVGRKNELEILDSLIQSQEAEFLAVYGRRRVGKTFLIREALDKHIAFECTGLLGVSKQEQLLNFWITLGKVSKIPTSPPSSWLHAFQYLEKYISKVKSKKGSKKVIFFDEISWFDTPKSGFLPAFTQFWNSYCSKNQNVLLVVCGSAASWIIDKVVNSRGGLHNRITQTIRLMPFELSEAREMLKRQKVKLAEYDTALLYMCIGGIPYYLKQVKPGRSVAQILNDLFFHKNAALKFEFSNLYASLFKNHELHENVIKVLASKCKGLTRNNIIKATKIASGGGLTKVLEELEECGFIMKTGDFDKKKENGLYRLIDEYSIFYFKFLKNPVAGMNGVNLFHSHAFSIWSGYAFENLCFKHHEVIASILGIQGVAYHIYSFIDIGNADSDGSQIDLLIDRADQVINIIEVKFYQQPIIFTKKMSTDMFRKVSSLRRKTQTSKTIFTTLLTVYPSTKNQYYLSTITNEILLRDFFDQ